MTIIKKTKNAGKDRGQSLYVVSGKVKSAWRFLKK
jgi:hypothetical protein